MIAINGMGSQIAKELLPLLPAGERAVPYRLDEPAPHAERFLFCQGHLEGRSLGCHYADTAAKTFAVNFMEVAAACDRILMYNDAARICILGSESGIAGSYDMAYAGAKAALHLYVETKNLGPAQQLVAVAPGIVADAGMTLRRDSREDQDRLTERARNHPKGRFCSALEVATLVRFLLYEDHGYLTGTVIRLNGGEHAFR